MRVLLAGVVSLLVSAAFAQDNVPPGGCMPIGLTARGDLVFPMQCRELIERERGPIQEGERKASEQRSQPEPAVKMAPTEKVTPVAAAPAAVVPEAVAPVAVAPVEVTPAENNIAATGQPQEQGRKKLSRVERRKNQGHPPPPVSDPPTTGSTTRWFSTTR
jgi:hypothetical protein